MKYKYKLKFTDIAQWQTKEAKLYNDKGEKLFKMADPVVGIDIPQKKVWNEETEQYDLLDKVEGYHVDVKSDEPIDLLNEFIVTVANPQHRFSGGGGFVVKSAPTDSWLKDDIKAWLTAQGIEWTTSMLKAELLELC